MGIRVITTVGTSLFSNYMDKDNVVRKYAALSKEYEGIAPQFRNLEYLSAKETTNSRYTSDINYITGIIEDLWLPFAKKKASAEIETLYKIAEEEKKDLDIYLLATDTVLSVVACELIKEWFDKNPSANEHKNKITCIFDSNTCVAEGLQIHDAQRFETVGFHNLLRIIQKYLSEDNNILNISGGYKAIIPYVTLFAQLENIPLKYMYEDSESLITVGNLPFSLDWAIVEALKPFLNKYFLKDSKEIQILGKYREEEKAKFENGEIIVILNKFKEKEKNIIYENDKFIVSDEEHKQKLTAFFKLFSAMVSYQLVIWDSKMNEIKASALGSLIVDFRFAMESNKGYIMEHLLFKYFAQKNNADITKGYTIAQPPIVQKHYVLDGKKIEIGDIDIWLNYNNTNNMYHSWVEVKALSTAQGYGKEEGWVKYYRQLKARVLALDKPYLETLFIVFRFYVQGINDPDFSRYELLQTAVGHLGKLNSDPDLNGKCKFRCLGISIPISFRKNRVDLTENFYKGNFTNWIWEEIKV